MAFENVLYDVRDRVAVITINRPDKLNALNRATVRELDAAAGQAASDAGVQAVLITGSGPKAFVAGADINELADQTPMGGKDYSLYGQQVLSRIEKMGKPVIAAVNGFALGGGCELAWPATCAWLRPTRRSGFPR